MLIHSNVGSECTGGWIPLIYESLKCYRESMEIRSNNVTIYYWSEEVTLILME